MAHVVFYEKPGFAGNERQKALLRQAGHELEVRDLVARRWARDELLDFLHDARVEDWFDRTSPAVRSGRIDPAALSPGQALELLLAEPGLLRSPFIEVGRRKEIGFLSAVIDEWIGLDPVEPAAGSHCGEGACGSGGCDGGEEPAPTLVPLGLKRRG